ncbi:MAG: N-acetylglucosamine-6-phosphate deacetylase [Candidatus Marinimicrobia bacterium]|nr:N-acetylglucosamine-6-phosphate deacetylase [Candidatus Neomarinimicrobiota bacterium]
MYKVFRNVKAITPFREIEDAVLVVQGDQIAELGHIADIEISDKADVYDLDGHIITPSFIDLHVHGAVGVDYTEADEDQIKEISEFLLSRGVTGVLATLYPKPKDALIQDVRRLAEYIRSNPRHNIIRGIHLEGPYLNPKMHGAINEDYIWEPDKKDWSDLRDAGRGTVRLMTIAPEVEGTTEIIRNAAREGIVPSIGHSIAEYDDISVAIDNGAAQVTHIFNAMAPFHHRKPGVLNAAFLHGELKVQLIADGIHVHPSVIQTLHKLKGASGIILISDAMAASGYKQGSYNFGDQEVTVDESGAHLADGTIAGSVATLDIGIQVLVKQAGLPLTNAVRMASLNPSRVLGTEQYKGILAVGKDADLVVMDQNFNVKMTLLNGDIVYSNL